MAVEKLQCWHSWEKSLGDPIWNEEGNQNPSAPPYLLHLEDVKLTQGSSGLTQRTQNNSLSHFSPWKWVSFQRYDAHSCSAEKIIPEGGGSTNRLWWDPNGMCWKGSRMDWHQCTQAVLKEKAGWGEILGLKWWQEKNPANWSSWHYLPSVKWTESSRKMKHASVSFILNGRAVASSSPQPNFCTAFYRPSVNYDCHYSTSLATVLQKHQWLLETGFLRCPWNRTQSTMWLLGTSPHHGNPAHSVFFYHSL